MKQFIIFGDYKNNTYPFRKDFKIFSFVEASSPYEAFKKWKEDVKDDISLFEEIVTIVEISDKKYYFNLKEN